MTEAKSNGWTFTATSRGYMFYFDGKPQGGAAILPSAKGPRGKQATRQVREYANYCRTECERRNREGVTP